MTLKVFEKSVRSIFLINLGIMVAYDAYLSTWSDGHGEPWIGMLLIHAILLLIQVVVNLVAGLVLSYSLNKKETGSALMMAGLVVGLIGFGLCAGYMVMKA